MSRMFRPALALSLTVLCIGTGKAQTPPPTAASLIRIREVEIEELPTPQYEVSVRGQSLRRDGSLDWLQVVAEYDTAPEWLDEITFTFHVALRGNVDDMPEGSEEVNVFSGTITIVHVPENRGHTIDMFLDPFTFARFGQPFAYAVEVEVNGEAAALVAEPSNLAARRWWESETPNAIPLKPRHETPFQLVEVERQGIVKP